MYEHKGFLYVILGTSELNIIHLKNNTVEFGIIFEDHVITSILVTDKLFLFADNFNHIYTIKREELYTENPKKERHIGHLNRVVKMVSQKQYIFTCSDDKTVKVWSHPDMELLDELTGHQNGIRSIAFANNHIYTGSYDYSIRSWDYFEMDERINERKKMKVEQFYSIKAEKYKGYLDNKKKRRRGGMKGKKGGMKK